MPQARRFGTFCGRVKASYLQYLESIVCHLHGNIGGVRGKERHGQQNPWWHVGRRSLRTGGFKLVSSKLRSSVDQPRS